MEQKFKVIYTGQLSDENNRELITKRFAERFKMPEAKASKILSAGKEVTLNPGAEHVKAYKLKAALEEMGLMMRLERVQMLKPKAEATEPAKAEAATNTTQNKPEPKTTAQNTEQAVSQRHFDTSAMSLEPMAEESDSDEETEESVQKEAVQEKSTEEKNKEDKINNPKAAADVTSPSWDLEPIQEEKTADNSEDEAPTEKQEFVDLSKPAMVYEKKTEDETVETDTEATEKEGKSSDQSENPIMSLIKQFGGVVVAGLVGILFLLKKFGLLKFLKIGGLMAAAAYAGYSPEEACMGNGDCEDAVSDQIDACWSYSELDKYDWDNMSDEQYYELKPQVEEKFIACFRYEENGAHVFESPIELRFDLIDMCDALSNPVADCNEVAEKQIKGCYDRAELGPIIKAADYDYFGSMMTGMENFKHFYGCFEDESGKMLFAEYVNDMDVDAFNQAIEQLQSEGL